MEKLKNKIIENKMFLLVGFFIILTLILPITQNELVIGDDYEYHISRIQSISDSLKLREFPVKIHSQLANGYGYASGIFYPNLFLYIPAILNVFGIHITISYKIFIGLMLCFMFVISYFSLKNITENKTSALIGTIVIMLSRNLIFNLYHRFALGEFLGFIFILPIISGMYDYVHKDFKKPWFLVIGFWGVINSHIITTVICLVVCIIYFLLNIKSTIKNWKKFVKLIICAVIAMCLTSSFWIPAIEQYTKQIYNFSTAWTVIGNSEYSFIDLLGNRKTSVGYLIAAFLPLCIYFLLDKRTNKTTKLFIVCMIFVMLLTVFHSFWKITNDVTNLLQFKWRLVGLITVFAGISIALIVKDLNSDIKINTDYIIIGLLMISMFWATEFTNFDNRTNIRISNQDLMKNMYIGEGSIGGGKEYFPVEVAYENLINTNIAFGSTGNKVDVKKFGLDVEFEKKENDTSYEIPFIYYYGYAANIENEEGSKALEVEKSENGLVKVLVAEEDIGTIHVWYDGTMMQKVSYIISAITYLGVVIYLVINIFKNKNVGKKE